MKMIFEEYGRTIIAVLAVVLLLAFIIGGLVLFKTMGTGVNVDGDLQHSQSEEALRIVSEREAPEISVPDTARLHLYLDQVEFKPKDAVACTDAEGGAVETTVTNIVLITEDGAHIALMDKYNKETDVLNIKESIDQTGALVVTFRAVDSYSVAAVKEVSFVVDAAVGE